MYLCIHKCLNGLVEHDMNNSQDTKNYIIDYNNRTRLNFRLPSVQKNWEKQRTAFHAIKDKLPWPDNHGHSVNVNIFKHVLLVL